MTEPSDSDDPRDAGTRPARPAALDDAGTRPARPAALSGDDAGTRPARPAALDAAALDAAGRPGDRDARGRAGRAALDSGAFDRDTLDAELATLDGTAPATAHDPGPVTRMVAIRERFDHWRHTYPKTEAAVFFAAGFAFDLLMLKRIDSLPMLIHQGAYNVLLTLFLVLDHRHTILGREYSGWLGKLVNIRYGLIHFLFGTLFNAYVVFYFRAAAGIGPMIFIGLIAALLVANELPRFRKLGPVLRFGLLGFSWASFLAYLLPTLAGFLDPWLFFLAIVVSAALAYVTWRVTSRITRDPAWTFSRGAAPALAAQLLLLLLYLAKVLPPVPLSLQTMGIAYQVAPRAGQLDVDTLTPGWKFWLYGDQQFHARPGDRVFVYARIFAPRRFKDTLYVRWAYDDPRRGWVESDRIPLTIKGGERDWRGWAYKRNYQPGEWRVTIETDDERALGRLDVSIDLDTATSTRTFRRIVE